MKTYEDIKKALQLCPGDSIDCEQDMCPYWEVRLCVPELHADALEIVDELEQSARNAQRTIHELTSRG